MWNPSEKVSFQRWVVLWKGQKYTSWNLIFEEMKPPRPPSIVACPDAPPWYFRTLNSWLWSHWNGLRTTHPSYYSYHLFIQTVHWHLTLLSLPSHSSIPISSILIQTPGFCLIRYHPVFMYINPLPSLVYYASEFQIVLNRLASSSCVSKLPFCYSPVTELPFATSFLTLHNNSTRKPPLLNFFKFSHLGNLRLQYCDICPCASDTRFCHPFSITYRCQWPLPLPVTRMMIMVQVRLNVYIITINSS